MEEFSFTPDEVQNSATPNDVSEFSFTPDEIRPDLSKVKGQDIVYSNNPIDLVTRTAKFMANKIATGGVAGNPITEAVGNMAGNLGKSYAENPQMIGEYVSSFPKTVVATGMELGKTAQTVSKAVSNKLDEQELYTFQKPDENDTIGAFGKELARGVASEIAVNTPKIASDVAYWLGMNMRDPVSGKTNAMADGFLGISETLKNVSDYMGDVEILKSQALPSLTGGLSWGQIGSVGGHGIGQGITMAVMARTMGAQAAYGFYALAGGGDVFRESYQKEGDMGKANTLATMNAAATYMIDRWFDPLPENIATGARMTAKQVAKEIGKTVVKEPLSEGLQQVFAENLVRKIGLDAEQDLFEGVIESMIGALGGAAAMGTASGAAAYSADRHYQEAKEKALQLGAEPSEIEQYRRATQEKLRQHPEAFDTVFQQNVQQTMQDINSFVKENGNPEEVRKALQVKADLDEVYNRVFEQIKSSDTDKVAAAQAKVVQGVALWGSQELGISPLEYFEQRFPRIEKVAYRDFARRLNEAKRAGEVSEINLYEALKNPALLKGRKVKDTRQSLTQFLKQNGGLKDFGGELKAMDAGKQIIGLINNKNGRNLDDMALAAWEAGYFPQSSERPTVNDLLDAISEELGGRKRYNEEAPYSLEDEVNQLAEDLDRIDIDWRNMEAPEIEMAVDAYMERQRAYNEEMGQEDSGDNDLAWFQGQITDNGRGVELTINSQEEMQGLSDEDFKSKMLDTLKSFKGNKIFNQSLNGDIEIRTSSIKKYKSFFADKNKRLIVPYVPELLGKARFIREESYMKASEPNIKAYYKADLPINIDDDSYNVHLTVREDQYGNFFWDAQVKEEPQHATPATNPGDTGLTSGLSEDGLSITQTSENVNNTLYQHQISDEQFEADLAEFDKILDSFAVENKGYYDKKGKFDVARKLQKKYQDFFMYNIADASNPNGQHDPFYFEYDGQKDFTNMWLPKKLEKGSSVILYRNAEQVSIPVTEFDENKFKKLGYKRQKKFDEGMRDIYTLNKDEKSDRLFYQSAFAGSRIDYDTPSLEAIGTGEGNQTHGWGLYYALNKDVAEGYRYKFITEDVGLTGDIITEIDRFGKEKTKKIYEDKLNSYKNELDKFNKEHTAEEIKEDDYLYLEKSNLENSIQVTESLLENIDNYTKGQVHEVDLPENPYLLDEDTAVWQQSDIVKDGISNLVDKLSDEQVGQLQVGQYDVAEKREILKSNLQSETGRKLYKTLTNVLGSKQAASEMLKSVGIKGITYDGNQDGRCFVIFNPADVKVIQKFYQDGADTLYRDPKGAFSQRIDRRAVISLFERADASTFMHETAHFFFEELKAFAATSEKSARMLKTVNDWLESDGETYTVEQTEQFARGFEQYLREGKAPSNYLKRVFDAFMNWMRQLYKTAKELNVKLNDEVRGVYGEILGGTDLDRYMDAPVSEVLGSTKRYWKAKREAMDDIYKQNVEAKKASVRLFKRGRETMQNVYTDMRNYLSDAIVPLEEEIKQISPELYNMNRRLEIDKLQKTSAYYKRIKGFVDGMQKMDAPDFYTFDLALKNRDVDTVQRLLEKYALTDGFAEVRNILDDLREQMIDVGVDVAYMPDYFPRKIKDADGLLDYVEQEFGGRPEYSIIQKMIEEKRKDGRIRTKEDEAQIVNSLIRGYAGGISIAKIGNVKERSIDVVDQHMNRFYKVSTDALIDYISGAVQMIENKKYFGRETKELQNLRRMVANRETTIAEYRRMEPKEAKWREIKTRNYKIGAVEAQIRNTFDKDVKAELQDRKTKLEAEVEFLRNRRAEQVKEIAINRMEVELAQVKKEVDELADSKIENSVGNLLLEMAEQGKISHTQELRLKELLLARFSNQGLGNEFWRLVRDGGYIWTLGNFESAITQFGDLGTSAYKNGLWNTAFEYAKAWTGKSEITIDDLGLGKIIQDGGFADTSAWSKALDKVLKYTGFEKMDKIAKQTLVNSAIRKARKDAQNNSSELEAYLRHEFGEKWIDVREDMKTGAITDEIMEYAMFQLMDVQPITIDQMPRYYAEGGKKRLFYMMKSYFIKQLNEYRKICFETAKTNPRKAVVDMTRLTAYLMLFNAGADVLKDLLFGRPVNVPDSLVDNIFIGGSINRYQAMSVKREGLFKTLQKQLMFPVMMDELVVDILSDKEVKDWNTWKNVPLVGRPYYWWFGGGHLKTLKEEKKARNERRNQRRRRRREE